MRWAPGHTPSLPDDLAPAIIAGIKQGPRGCGLDRTSWTYGELTTHLYGIVNLMQNHLQTPSS
jgi:hypothetical protein